MENQNNSTWWKDILISSLAFIICFLVAVGNLLSEKLLNFSPYTIMGWGIIPGGAICLGMLSASGYYIGAKQLNIKPNKSILINMVLASIGVFFLINYISYSSMEIEGEPINSYISFSEYLDITLTKSHYKFTRTKTDLGEMGSIGYIIGLLQIFGFAVGGSAIYIALKEEKYCDKCKRYLLNNGQKYKFYESQNTATDTYERLISLLNQNQFKEILSLHETRNKPTNNEKIGSWVEHKHCPKCHMEYLEMSLQVLKSNEWETVPNTKFFKYS